MDLLILLYVSQSTALLALGKLAWLGSDILDVGLDVAERVPWFAESKPDKALTLVCIRLVGISVSLGYDPRGSGAAS